MLLIDTRRRDRGRSVVSMAETVVDKLVGKLAVRECRGRYEIRSVSTERPRDSRGGVR